MSHTQKLCSFFLFSVSFLYLGLLFVPRVLAQDLPETPFATESSQSASEQLLEPMLLTDAEMITSGGPPTFHRARIIQVLAEDTLEIGGYYQTQQTLQLELANGQYVTALWTLPSSSDKDLLLTRDQTVVVVEQQIAEGEESLFTIADVYRLPSMLLILGLFVLVIVVLSGIRGVTALSGLAFSIILLLYFVVPQIAGGADPVFISLISSVFIGGVALYLAHGFNVRTTISLVSTMITLTFAVIAAFSFVSMAKLFGLGSEESLELQYGAMQNINLQGLLLAGIIIGALGVLDDITTAQTAAVAELKRANQKFTLEELYNRGMAVGKEHITSLVNTLALAYAGASLPMLLLFTVYQQPLWVTLNSEFVVEEVIRTVVGSLALTIAVPITTFLAAYWFSKHPVPEDKSSGHSHSRYLK